MILLSTNNIVLRELLLNWKKAQCLAIVFLGYYVLDIIIHWQTISLTEKLLRLSFIAFGKAWAVWFADKFLVTNNFVTKASIEIMKTQEATTYHG